MSLVFNMVGGGGGGIKLTGIAITTPPTKTTYTQGETFDPAGMVVTATYSNGATLKCTGYSYEPNTPLADGTTKVTIRYTEGGVTKTGGADHHGHPPADEDRDHGAADEEGL